VALVEAEDDMGKSTWYQVLPSMIERLDAIEQFLQGIGEAPPPFEMPEGDVAPLPAELRDWALYVLARTRRAASQVALAATEVARRIGQVEPAGRGDGAARGASAAGSGERRAASTR
jgi:hypothetical protein